MSREYTHDGLEYLHERLYLMPHLKNMREHAEKYIDNGLVIILAHASIFSKSGRIGCTCEEYKRSDAYRKWLDDEHAQKRMGHLKYDPDFICTNPGKHPKGSWKNETKGLSLKQAIHHWSRVQKVTDVDTGEKVEVVWNMGILPGPSNVLTFDADTYKETYACDLEDVFSPDELDTPQQQSHSGGLHIMFDREGKPYTNANGELKQAGIEGVDIRGDGGFQVIAPSLGYSGNEYEWIEGYEPWNKSLKPIPADLDAILAQSVTKKAAKTKVEFSELTTEKPDLAQWHLSQKTLKLLHNPAPVGERSEADYSVACALVRAGASDDAIKAFFDHYPIGTQGAYAEKGAHYLSVTIANARAFIDSNPPADSNFQSMPREAIWHNADHDEPVTVTGSLGERDGIEYFSIKGSSTGIPATEIEFQAEAAPLSLDELVNAIRETATEVTEAVKAGNDKATGRETASAVKDAVTLCALDHIADIAKLSATDFARLKVALRGNCLTSVWVERELPKLIMAEKAKQRVAAQPAGDEPRYKVDAGRICHRYEKQVMQGEDVTTVTGYAPLCNFDASILADVDLDDGEEVTKHLAVVGRLDTGEALPEITIPAKAFETMQWPVEYWGAKAAIEPGRGKKDILRHGIQFLSMDEIEHRHAYTHTGLRKIDGKLVFLHAGGAIGLDGVTVSLPRQMDNYRFPDDDAVDYVTAMRESIKLMAVAPMRVSAPMYAMTYLAPLSEIILPAFVPNVKGGSGSFKSSYTALFLNHYGAKFTEYTMPADWLATPNSLEKLTFHAKDVLLVIDDLRPATNPSEKKQLDDAVSRIARAVGNRQGRSRLDSNSDFRRTFTPRGVVAMTAEKNAMGYSVNSRLMSIEVEAGEINADKLTEAQSQRHVYAYAMRGFIEYVIEHWDELNKVLPSRVADTRALSNGNGHHKRLPNATATLYTAF